jgi:GntR family transcriptional regulator
MALSRTARVNTRQTISGTLRLDHRSPLPLHAQAEQLLRTLIQREEYRNGGLLPDEVSLSRTLGISRNTLRAAVLRLVADGRLERKAGVGTRVVEPTVKSGVGAWHSFTREMAGKGVKVETYSLNVKWVPVPVEAAQALKIPSKTKVLCLDRVRGWDAQPEVVFRSYFHPRLHLTDKEDFCKPLYELIHEHCSVVADESLEEFTAMPADRQLARLLQVPVGSPLLRRERTVLDTGRKPVEFAVVHYRCDRFRLTLKLRQE